MASAENGNEHPRRKVLAAAVGAILFETGFQNVEKAALGTLVEVLQSVICEIGRSSKQYMEIAYRTNPIVEDIKLGITQMGLNIDGLHTYAKRHSRLAISAPGYQVESKTPTILQVGEKKNHPPYVYDYMPPFPDTHTYCFTHTYKQPVTEYEAIRERSAQQKMDTENAITKFATKTNESVNLLNCDDSEFMVICPSVDYLPYIDALMPRDQYFEEDYEEETYKKKRKSTISMSNNHSEENQNNHSENSKEKESPEISNPYLQSVKMPKKYKRSNPTIQLQYSDLI